MCDDDNPAMAFGKWRMHCVLAPFLKESVSLMDKTCLGHFFGEWHIFLVDQQAICSWHDSFG